MIKCTLEIIGNTIFYKGREINIFGSVNQEKTDGIDVMIDTNKNNIAVESIEEAVYKIKYNKL